MLTVLTVLTVCIDLDSTDPCFPSYNAHDPYRITHGLEKMRSAYTTVHGSEWTLQVRYPAARCTPPQEPFNHANGGQAEFICLAAPAPAPHSMWVCKRS